ARVITRSNQCEDNASLVLRVLGDGRIKQVRTGFGNNSLCDQIGREKCAVNIGIECEVFGHEASYTLCVEHLRSKCRPQSTRGIRRRNNPKIARGEFLDRLSEWFTQRMKSFFPHGNRRRKREGL